MFGNRPPLVCAPGNRGAHHRRGAGAAAVPLLWHGLRVPGYRGFGAAWLAGEAVPDPVAAAQVPAALPVPGQAGRTDRRVRAPAAEGDPEGPAHRDLAGRVVLLA